jgi:hypothetical protein
MSNAQRIGYRMSYRHWQPSFLAAFAFAVVGSLAYWVVGAPAAETLETPNSLNSASQTSSSATGRADAASAQKTSSTTSPITAKPAAKPLVKQAPVLLTPEREAAALQFVHEHHPELVELLKGLKTSHLSQYQAAVRQLYQTSERLAKIHEVDPARYELELKLWKIKSRIQLIAARASLSRDAELESQLKAALIEQSQVQLQEMQYDRDRIADRLKNLDRMVDQFQSNEERTIDKQYAMLMREIERQRAQAAKLASSSKSGNASKTGNASRRYSAKPVKPTNSNSTPSSSNSSNPASPSSKAANQTNTPTIPPTDDKADP